MSTVGTAQPSAYEVAQDKRDAAFMDSRVQTREICGVPCKPVTARTWIALTGMRNPLLTAARDQKFSDLVDFVFLHAPEYHEPYLSKVPLRRVRLWWPPVTHDPINWKAALHERMWSASDDEKWHGFHTAEQMLDDAFFDSNAAKGSGNRPDTSILAPMIYLVGKDCNMSPDEVLDYPLAAYWQLFKEVMKDRLGEKYSTVFIDRTEAAQLLRMLDAARNGKVPVPPARKKPAPTPPAVKKGRKNG